VGEHPPLAAGADDVEQGVDDLPAVVLGRPAARLGGGDESRDLGPLGLGQVGQVGLASVHTLKLGADRQRIVSFQALQSDGGLGFAAPRGLLRTG